MEEILESMSMDLTNSLQIGVSDFSSSLSGFETQILASTLASVTQVISTSVDDSETSTQSVLDSALADHSQAVAAVGLATNELIQAHQQDRKYSASVVVREKLRMRWMQLHLAIDQLGQEKMQMLRDAHFESLQVDSKFFLIQCNE
jgi:hypothetical protein